MQKKNSKKGIVILAVVLAVCVAVAFGVYLATRPAGQAGDKTITVVIDAGDGNPKTTQVRTSEEFLGPMLVAENLASGDSGDFGLFITQAGGVTANDSRQEWWCITKGGAEVLTGADEIALADGEQFELTLTTGY